MVSIIVRIATGSDAQQIARVQVESWRAAYVNIISASYLEKLSIEDKTQFWTSVFANPDGQSDILVAEAEQESKNNVLGFASYCGLAQDGVERRAELRAVYVSPAAWSQGIGYRLCQTVLERLAQTRPLPAVLDVWVYAQNARAIKFYERFGFEKTAEGRSDPAGTDVATVRLSKELAAHET